MLYAKNINKNETHGKTDSSPIRHKSPGLTSRFGSSDTIVLQRSANSDDRVQRMKGLQRMADKSSRVQSLQVLQRTANDSSLSQNLQALQRKTVTIHPKLTVSNPGDPAEIEADKAAQQVVSNQPLDQNTLHRKPDSSTTTRVDASTANQINNINGGSPLSTTERSYFEPRFGANFGNVRVHTGNQAAGMAAAVNAKAFTKGNDIVFAKGQYQPGTESGDKLMAHELAHVVQGGSGVKRVASDEQGESKTPKEQIQEIYDTYAKGDTNIETLAIKIVPYAIGYSEEIIKIIEKVSWTKRDNLSYEITKKSTDSMLAAYDEKLLLKLKHSMFSLINAISSILYHIEKKRIDKILNSFNKNQEEVNIEKDWEQLRKTFNYSISGPVGAASRSTNYFLDVIYIAKALKRFGYNVSDDSLTKGKCDDTLIKAIEKFQKKEFGIENPDKTVDPNGDTIKKLYEGSHAYTSGLTNIYGKSTWKLNNILSNAKILDEDVGADYINTRNPAKNNPAENNPMDVKKVALALAQKGFIVPIVALNEGKCNDELIACIKKFQKKHFNSSDGNITAGGRTARKLLKDFSIKKLVRNKEGNEYKFNLDSTQDRRKYMKTIDILAESIGLEESSDEAKVLKLAEKAANNQQYFEELTKNVSFEVKYARREFGSNKLNSVLEHRMMRFHKFMCVAGFYRGDIWVGTQGAVRDPAEAHKWSVEHSIVMNKRTTDIKSNLIEMYNKPDDFDKSDSVYIRDLNSNPWAKKEFFTIEDGKATDLDMSKVKDDVNTFNYRDAETKTASAAEGYTDKRRMPHAVNGKPIVSNHIYGNALDIPSKLFVNRNDAIIDLIALKFGVIRCVGGEQWHFEITNVALSKDEKEEHERLKR